MRTHNCTLLPPTKLLEVYSVCPLTLLGADHPAFLGPELWVPDAFALQNCPVPLPERGKAEFEARAEEPLIAAAFVAAPAGLAG